MENKGVGYPVDGCYNSAIRKIAAFFEFELRSNRVL